MRENSFIWLAEPMMDEASYIQKPMFGCQACYLHGKLMLVLADGSEPWSGVLCATERAFHESLVKDIPELAEHPVLGKWLYISSRCEGFERAARNLVGRVLRNDPRIGVLPSSKSRKKKSPAGMKSAANQKPKIKAAKGKLGAGRRRR